MDYWHDLFREEYRVVARRPRRRLTDFSLPRRETLSSRRRCGRVSMSFDWGGSYTLGRWFDMLVWLHQGRCYWASRFEIQLRPMSLQAKVRNLQRLRCLSWYQIVWQSMYRQSLHSAKNRRMRCVTYWYILPCPTFIWECILLSHGGIVMHVPAIVRITLDMKTIRCQCLSNMIMHDSFQIPDFVEIVLKWIYSRCVRGRYVCGRSVWRRCVWGVRVWRRCVWLRCVWLRSVWGRWVLPRRYLEPDRFSWIFSIWYWNIIPDNRSNEEFELDAEGQRLGINHRGFVCQKQCGNLKLRVEIMRIERLDYGGKLGRFTGISCFRRTRHDTKVLEVAHFKETDRLAG